jgi:hypothetical protein
VEGIKGIDNPGQLRRYTRMTLHQDLLSDLFCETLKKVPDDDADYCTAHFCTPE